MFIIATLHVTTPTGFHFIFGITFSFKEHLIYRRDNIVHIDA
jgi:hypothetical protein